MLLRVRSNVGTWKYQFEPTDTLSNLSQQITQKWKLLLPISKDPGGHEPLPMERSLSDLGMTHGTMIYCRVEPNSAETCAAASVSHVEAKQPPVIDLVDSDDDEDDKLPSVQITKRRRSSPSKKEPMSISSKKVKSTADPSIFQIASYNVWFGPPDPSAKQVHPQARMTAIAKELSSCEKLIFVGFQELTSSLCGYLEPHLKSMGYRFCTQPLGGTYGVGLAIRKDIPIVESKFLPYQDTCQGRGLLFVETPTMLFATTHLESFLDAKKYDGATQREAQIIEATTFCEARLRQKPHLSLAVITGDFNWDDERPKAPNQSLVQVAKGWYDPGTPKDYTYDGKENPMLGGSLRRRLDRCLYFSPNKAISTQFQKLGMEAIPDLTWNKKNPFNGTTRTVPVAPSDHFGIAVTFQMNR